MKSTRKQRFIGVPGLKATSCLTVVLLIFLETVLLSTVSNCAKTFFMHWNTSNSIFRIDNTDHIIDVNKGNLAFEYDQVHIICPVYEPGTFDNETEKYIIYNVSKVEYETCRITNANPRIIAICDKPQKLMYFTITFRPFTPQPGGLEFLPGNDYYFISTSSKDDLHRRIGGRCSTNNMKVVFKVCCASETDSQNATQSSLDGVSKNLMPTRQPSNDRSGTIITGNTTGGSNDGRVPPLTINTNRKSTMTWLSRDNDGSGGYRHSIPITSTISVQQYHPHPTSSRPFINSAINKFNKNPNNNNNNNNNKNYNNNNNYNHSNNAPSLKPTKKTNEYDKHPNEVVKNEELTLNNHGTVLRPYRSMRHSAWYPLCWIPQDFVMLMCIMILVFANYYDHLHTMIQSYLPNLWWRTMLSSVTNDDDDDTIENQMFLNYLKSNVIPGNPLKRSNYDRYKTTSDFVKLHTFKRNNINEIDISKRAIAERVSLLTKIITITSSMPHIDTVQPTYIFEKFHNDETESDEYYSRDDNAFNAFVINAIHRDESDIRNVINRKKRNFLKNHLDDLDKFDNNNLNKLNVCHSSKNKNLDLKKMQMQMQIGRRNCINPKTQTTSTFDTDTDSNLNPEMIIIINKKSLIS